MKTKLINDNEVTFLNSRLSDELTAEQFYLQLGTLMQNNGFLGFAKYFFEASNEEKTHAQKVIDYANKLGVSLTTNVEKLQIPKNIENNPLELFRMSFKIEDTLRLNYSTELLNPNLFTLVQEMVSIQVDSVGEV